MARSSPTDVGPADKSRRQEKASVQTSAVSRALSHDYNALIKNNAKLVDTSTTAFIEKLLGVKTLETAVQLQSEFAKSQFEGFLAQTNKIGEIYRDIAREALRPVAGSFVKQTDLPPGDDEPSHAQWLEIKQLALKEASAGLKSPQTHLASILSRLATLRDVE